MSLSIYFCFLASLFTYHGRIVLPHDPATGLVGISPTNGILYQTTTKKLSPPPVLRLGQLVSVSEELHVEGQKTDRLINAVQVLDEGTPPSFIPVSAKTLNAGANVGEYVSFKGVVQDVFRDDIDNRFIAVSISADGSNDRVHWTGACKADDSQLYNLIGATVEASGLAVNGSFASRRNCGPCIFSTSTKSLTIVSKPTIEMFDAPDISTLEHTHPSDIAFNPRHRTSGFVLAVLDKQTFLIQRTNGSIATVHLAFSSAPPQGAFIEVVGFPESDLYTINLARATWRRARKPEDATPPKTSPAPCTISKLLPRVDGTTTPHARLHGQLLRITGTVRRVPLPDESVNTALIEAGGQFLKINPGISRQAFKGLELGSVVAVTGVAFIEKEYWRPNLCFPAIRQISLITRGSYDIEIISGPPFWTPLKLFFLIIMLSAIVIVILMHGRTIQRLSKERVNERSRLAAELHDTIAQNLTGAAIQLETAESLASNESERLKRILSFAIKILHSSREELRDCIWDLRNRTLDEKRIDDGIRRTLMPNLSGAELRIRFPVIRTDISDRSVHTAISIIRELVANAIHHGNASTITIAGTLEKNMLKFSVSDNGHGFDVDHTPGPHEGHFGLTGIRERIRKLKGTVTIKSNPGQGTKAIITLQK